MSFFLPICSVCREYFTDENNNHVPNGEEEDRLPICPTCEDNVNLSRCKMNMDNATRGVKRIVAAFEPLQLIIQKCNQEDVQTIQPLCSHGQTYNLSEWYNDVDVDQIRMTLSTEFAMCNGQITQTTRSLEEANRSQRHLNSRRLSFQERLNQIRSQFERMIGLLRERQSETMRDLQEVRSEQEQLLLQKQCELKRKLSELRARKHSLSDLMALSNEDLLSKTVEISNAFAAVDSSFDQITIEI